jgi:hypothetical protein
MTNGLGNVVVFLVGNKVQMDNAIAVTDHMDRGRFEYLDLWSGRLSDVRPTFDGHTPKVTVQRLARILRSVRLPAQSVLVIPQDVGLLQRVIARRARLAGARIVLMPDGVVASGVVRNGSSARQELRNVVDRLMRMLGLVEGKAGNMGSSRPDAILSWGPGWDVAFDIKDNTKVHHVGCPRMDKFAELSRPRLDTKNLLVCSQPLFIPAWSRPYADRWYEFVSLLLATETSTNVRIRLHPAETSDAQVPATLRQAHSAQELGMDLEWATHVVSPFSTVLVEAIAARRSILSLAPDSSFQKHANQYPFFNDPRMPIAQWDQVGLLNIEMTEAEISALASEYVNHVGSSGVKIVNILETIALNTQDE